MKIISLDLAKKLKKLGFINIPCQYYYKNSELQVVTSNHSNQLITDIWIDTNCLNSDKF